MTVMWVSRLQIRNTSRMAAHEVRKNTHALIWMTNAALNGHFNSTAPCTRFAVRESQALLSSAAQSQIQSGAASLP